MGDVYVLAKQGAGLASKLEAAKWFAKMGNLEPKEEKSSSVLGAGFSITVDLGGGASLTIGAHPGAAEKVVDGEVVPEHIASMPFTPGELSQQAAA